MPIPADRTNIVAIAAGYDHDLLLRKDGTILAWGLNQYGQTDVPTDLSNVVAIAAGGDHSLALTSNGTVVPWGRDSYPWGQSAVPAEATNVSTMAAGYEHSLALRNDGAIIAWGANADGQMNVPPGVSNVLALAAGQRDSFALHGDTPASPTLRAEAPLYSNGVFSVSVQTRADRSYQLEYKDNLADSGWTSQSPIPGDGTLKRLTAPAPVPRRYFRVREL